MESFVPSLLHESILEMFRARPSLAAELLAAAQVLPPELTRDGILVDAQFNQVLPVEFRADLLCYLRGPQPMGAVVEAQPQPDPDKLWSWAVYLAAARAQLRCPVILLVIALNGATERWASAPIELGPGSVIQPVVLGPRRIPIVTDPELAAQSPELAVLSAIVHGNKPIAAEIGRVALSVAITLDEDRSRLYSDLIILTANDTVRKILESLMLQNWEPQSEFFKNLVAKANQQGRAEGLAEGHLDGLRDLLVRQLTRRFGELPPAIRARIGAANEEQLETWGEELLFADSLEALFGA